MKIYLIIDYLPSLVRYFAKTEVYIKIRLRLAAYYRKIQINMNIFTFIFLNIDSEI